MAHSCLTEKQRFFAKVTCPDARGCMTWTAGRNRHGRYGHFRLGERKVLAHRWAYAYWIGPIPHEMCVCHLCDNPTCVAPWHLFLGTHADNMNDMNNKGRGHPPQGEAHGSSKLTGKDAAEIRERYSLGDVHQSTLGKEYGVGQAQISRIIRRTRWKHVS